MHTRKISNAINYNFFIGTFLPTCIACMHLYANKWLSFMYVQWSVWVETHVATQREAKWQKFICVSMAEPEV